MDGWKERIQISMLNEEKHEHRYMCQRQELDYKLFQ
ncbi:hypothetical protein A2U01_0008510, partial [Trifolium medium]|nr:hypothetical protein [Trifolium medium]